MRLAPFALLLVASTASAAVPTVAVLPFRDLSGGKASVGEAIRETVTSDLKTLGGVRVVERAQLDRVLGEQHLQGTGEFDAATASASADLAALEKRMKGYEALARAKQDEKSRALLDEFAKEKDPQKQASMAMQVLNTLLQARRYRTLVAVARSIMAGPAAAA